MTQEQLATWVPLILIFVLMWFFIVRPQQQQQKKRQQMLQSLKKGDKVVTVGGIKGTITGLTDQEVRLRIADQVQIEMTRSGIGYVIKEENEKEDA